MGTGYSMGKGPEVGASLLCPRIWREAQMSHSWEVQRGIHRVVAWSPGL